MEIVNPINSYNENKMFKASYGGKMNVGLYYPLRRGEGVVISIPTFPKVTLRILVP